MYFEKKISAIWPFWLEKVLIKHTSIVEEKAQHNVSSCNNTVFLLIVDTQAASHIKLSSY